MSASPELPAYLEVPEVTSEQVPKSPVEAPPVEAPPVEALLSIFLISLEEPAEQLTVSGMLTKEEKLLVLSFSFIFHPLDQNELSSNLGCKVIT